MYKIVTTDHEFELKAPITDIVVFIDKNELGLEPWEMLSTVRIAGEATDKEWFTFATWLTAMTLHAEREKGREPLPARWQDVELRWKWLHGMATDEEIEKAYLKARPDMADPLIFGHPLTGQLEYAVNSAVCELLMDIPAKTMAFNVSSDVRDAVGTVAGWDNGKLQAEKDNIDLQLKVLKEVLTG